MPAPSWTVAVDIGGTFTDLFASNDSTQEIRQAKTSTTPANLVSGIIECLRKSGISGSQISHFIHGSTTAINTVIERKGAKTALVVTRGTRDVYSIGRSNRPEAYNIFFRRPEPLIPRHLTFEVDERLMSSGEVLIAFDKAQMESLANEISKLGMESVAVCFLHSYVNPSHEIEAGKILKEKMPKTYLSLSHQIMREYGEYERTSTTVVNSYIGPTVGDYIRRLQRALESIGFGREGLILIMQSNGGVMSPEVAFMKPVTMMESGPVGGIIAASRLGSKLGYTNVISFDMGGTTAKTSLVRSGEPTISEGYYVGGYASGQPVMIPVVDIVEVGAGGGSIAWIDEIGALKVGPRSAGAEPGPMCYDHGGNEPTITDANVVLNRLNPDYFLGGEMILNKSRASEGIRKNISEPLSMSTTEAAFGIVRIAITKMSLMVREISVAKGYDPREFALVACGGAGPVHSVSVARDLHIPRVIIPNLPAHFSAVGMLLAELRHDYFRTLYEPLSEADFNKIEKIFDEMLDEGKNTLAGENVSERNMIFTRLLDLRYVGQEFTLKIPVSLNQIRNSSTPSIRKEFDRLHDARYGHNASEEPLEIVNLHLVAVGRSRKSAPMAPSLSKKPEKPVVDKRLVYLDDADNPVECNVYRRENLKAGQKLRGPAIIEEYASTTVLFKKDAAEVERTGEIIVTVAPEDRK